MISEIETAIVSKLTTALNLKTVRLAAFPDTPEEFGQPLSKSQILVGYKRSSFDKLSEFPIQIEQNLEFEITFQLVGLRTHTGIYPVLDLARSTLLGYVPITGASRGLSIISEGFTDLDPKARVWYYSQVWAIALVIPGDYGVIPDLPPIQVDRLDIGLWRSEVDSLPDTERSVFDRVIKVDSDA